MPPSLDVRADDHREIWQPVADRLELGQILAVGDERSGAAVGQPALERGGPEKRDQRYRDRAHLVGRDVGDGGLGIL
jgi:hypothetical protein